MIVLLFNCGCSKKIEVKEYGDSKKVILKGKIVTKEFYGPPNYGENPDTDVIESFYFLILDKPILIETNSTINSISEIQMVLFTEYQKTISKQAEYIVKGTLFLGHTGHHHSEVLITVNELREEGMLW